MDDISIKEACEGVKSFLSNQGRYLAYLDEEMCRMDREAQITSAFQDGKEEGMQEGIDQTRQQIVLNLLQGGFNSNLIKKMTGSTDDEIQVLATRLNIKN